MEGFGWVRPENYHLTLKFLGSTPEARVADWVRELGAVAERSREFELRARGIGAFASLARARVLWVGIEGVGAGRDASGTLAKTPADVADAAVEHDGLAELRMLVEAIDSAGERLSWKREERKYTPHLTIARNKSFSRGVDLRRVIDERAAGEDFGVSRVSELVLYESRTLPTGSVYEVVARFPF